MRLPGVLAVVVGVLLAGCSGEETPPAGAVDGLAGALGQVRATADTRVAVEYGAPARVRELGERFQTLQGYGFGTIANSARLVDDALGVDPGSFEHGIVVGQAPRWGAVLWGDYDVAAVDGKLREKGIDSAEQGGGTLWTSGKDFEISLADGPFVGVVPLNEFNDIHTASGSFAFAPARVGVEWVTDAGDETLAEDAVIAGYARCLGDVVAARIDQEVAVGVREDGTELVCLDAELEQVEKALDGDVPSTREPWDEFLAGADVRPDGELVRITVPGDEDLPVGRVLRAQMTGDLRGLA